MTTLHIRREQPLFESAIRMKFTDAHPATLATEVVSHPSLDNAPGGYCILRVWITQRVYVTAERNPYTDGAWRCSLHIDGEYVSAETFVPYGRLLRTLDGAAP